MLKAIRYIVPCCGSGQKYSDPLLYIENILIFAAFGCFLLFRGIAMQVYNINSWELLYEALSHPAKSWIINVSMICDEAEHTNS